MASVSYTHLDVYKRQLCHGASAQGTWEVPPLTGRFFANWGHGSVGALADYVGRAMPQMAPGTLEPQEKVAIVAFLLKSNGMPAGAKPLPADAATLGAIMIEPVAPKATHLSLIHI